MGTAVPAHRLSSTAEILASKPDKIPGAGPGVPVSPWSATSPSSHCASSWAGICFWPEAPFDWEGACFGRTVPSLLQRVLPWGCSA